MTKLSGLSTGARRVARSRMGGREGGFTLLELLVVLLIVGVLLVVGIPTLLSYLAATGDADAQANLKTALAGANALYGEQFNTYSGLCTSQGCGGGPVGGFAGTDTGLNGVTAKTQSLAPQDISIYVSRDGSVVVLTALATSTNNCWAIVESNATTTVLSHKAPVTLYVLEKSKSHKPATCYAGARIFSSPVKDVTNALTGHWPRA